MKLFYSRRLWFSIVFMLIAIVAILLYINIELLLRNWFETLKYLFGIAGLITTLYTYWKKFNLLITRIRIILLNSSSKWNVTANFEGDFNSSVQMKIKHKLLEIEGSNSFNFINDKSFSININGLQYVFDYVDEYIEELTDTQGTLICRINDFYCSYDKSIEIFQKRITPILRSIEHEVRPERSKFTFKVQFNGNNPFISLIAKNIDSKKVNSLWYSFNDSTVQGSRNIKITERALECTTTDITDFQSSSVNFISLVGD